MMVEGLVNGRAPSGVGVRRAACRGQPLETRRLVGLAALAVGKLLVGVAASLGVLG